MAQRMNNKNQSVNVHANPATTKPGVAAPKPDEEQISYNGPKVFNVNHLSNFLGVNAVEIASELKLNSSEMISIEFLCEDDECVHILPRTVAISVCMETMNMLTTRELVAIAEVANQTIARAKERMTRERDRISAAMVKPTTNTAGELTQLANETTRILGDAELNAAQEIETSRTRATSTDTSKTEEMAVASV